MTLRSFKLHAAAWLGASLLAVTLATPSKAALIAYYNFDKANPGTDTSGSSLNLTSNGTPGSVSGVNGNAVTFDGTSSLVRTMANQFYPATPTLSASFAVKPTVASENNLYVTGTTVKNGPAVIFQNGKLAVFVYGANASSGESVVSSTVLSTTAFTQIAFTFNDTDGLDDGTAAGGAATGKYTGTLALYINGNLESSKVVTTAVGSGTFGIGGKGGTVSGFTGAVDDFAIYDQTLTQTQISSLASGATPPTVVPEPGSLALLGMSGLVALRRRRGN